jgi:D-ribulokinase
VTNNGHSYIGIDVGTSGVRGILISSSGKVLAEARTALPQTRDSGGMKTQNPQDWWNAVVDCLRQLASKESLSDVAGLCVDGTSGTTLLTDAKNQPLTPALMYSDMRSPETARKLLERIPQAAAACSPGSALLKAWWLRERHAPTDDFFIQQQADWILSRLRGAPGISDWNNALKLGYDVVNKNWPEWMLQINWPVNALPDVFAPGTQIDTIDADIAAETGLPQETQLHAGTTDGVAAFLASGASRPGDAMTSLGSTLILKLCSRHPVTSTEHGVYSHRLDENRWLTGGASNTGGAVLKQLFTDSDLKILSQQMNPDISTGRDYYPLPAVGERFPVNDPEKKPLMSPVPDDPTVFLQGLFEGIARIEKTGYDLLEQLGTDPVMSIRTTGGGAVNTTWTSIRERIVSRPMLPSLHNEAAYGTARLAAGLV